MPARPVAQLAFPEFTRTARTRQREESRLARPTSTGAATTRFCVNKAAAVAPLAASARAKSGLPLALIPAATAEKEKPSGRRTFSGERRSEVMRGSSASLWAAAKWQTWATRHGPSRLRHSGRAGDIDDNLYEFYPADPGGSQLKIPCARKNPGSA